LFAGTIAAVAMIAAVTAAPARAVDVPLTLGLGQFVPTSPNSSVEGFPTFPGDSVKQVGQIGLELTFRPKIPFVSYQVSALLLSQHQTVSMPVPIPPMVAAPGDETITQIPLMLEETSANFGPVHFGGGLGYDFVSYPHASGAQAGSGILGDTFLQVGVASGAALEAKYLFGQRAALGGIFVGIETKL
jgi:hypothetical protein